jgi:mono/diheme cytochrome c family protein
MKILTALLLAGAISAAPLPKGDAAKGKELFMQCQLCHSPDAWRTGGLLARKGGPSLRRLYQKSKLTTTGKPVNDDSVLEVINNGGKGMVPYKDSLSAQQKADLIAYLKSQ